MEEKLQLKMCNTKSRKLKAYLGVISGPNVRGQIFYILFLSFFLGIFKQILILNTQLNAFILS